LENGKVRLASFGKKDKKKKDFSKPKCTFVTFSQKKNHLLALLYFKRNEVFFPSTAPFFSYKRRKNVYYWSFSEIPWLNFCSLIYISKRKSNNNSDEIDYFLYFSHSKKKESFSLEQTKT
jgi:hypothetical protein